MKILVTAGATQTPIDKVRAITNIFKGKTGTQIATILAHIGHNVTLLTSNPELVYPDKPRNAGAFHCVLPFAQNNDGASLRAISYRTFDDLAARMEEEIRNGEYDVVIHSAAVSDYKVARVLVNMSTKDFNLIPLDSSKKISGSHERMYLELVPTFKIVDKIRSEWGFKGFLVKFKLQVGITDEDLLDIARRSRETSDADLIVANCLEWAKEYAYVVDRDSMAEKVTRDGIGPAIARRMHV